MDSGQADAIMASLEQGWHKDGPYRGGKCLGMAVSDTLGSQGRQAVQEVQAQIRHRFPDRIKGNAPAGMLMFNCCDSQVIPRFNAHPDTTLDDLRTVIQSAVPA